jgi:hypothetical protein
MKDDGASYVPVEWGLKVVALLHNSLSDINDIGAN